MNVSQIHPPRWIHPASATVLHALGVPMLHTAAFTQHLEQPLQLPELESTPEITELHEPLYRVLLHNDEITPFDYVMSILGKVFMLSEELAEHIAVTAHSEGISVVIIRHRSEAQRLSEVANRSARADGFPLTFTCEPDS